MLNKFIALTSANQPALHAVTMQLLEEITQRGEPVVVLQGVRTAAEANAVYLNHGEIWCVGSDAADPELDPLVDRTIDDSTPERIADGTTKALDAFLGKVRVAV